ncbi:GL16681 [Drosophila persimilis]|uniref:GL16681 n=1 Tax=Drosophila persimilis TaxID=7234 RepID=B4IRL1_DROPE|nr:GL16681 [Drosophila persimilis]
MLLNAAKDMLPTYHGNISGNNDDVTTWIVQFKAIAKVNKLRNEKLLMLLMSKLKDKELVWLHSSPEHMSLPIDQLLNVMEDTKTHNDYKQV